MSIAKGAMAHRHGELERGEQIRGGAAHSAAVAADTAAAAAGAAAGRGGGHAARAVVEVHEHLGEPWCQGLGVGVRVRVMRYGFGFGFGVRVRVGVRIVDQPHRCAACGRS